MGLFGLLHPTKKDNLGGREMGEKIVGLDPLAGTGQGIPELAGAVSETGEHQEEIPGGILPTKGIITL
jgi:hypothetical protein